MQSRVPLNDCGNGNKRSLHVAGRAKAASQLEEDIALARSRSRARPRERGEEMERAKGIEPSYAAWETDLAPLIVNGLHGFGSFLARILSGMIAHYDARVLPSR